MPNQVTVHMLVENEEQWVWYAINSILDYVDRIIIYDTGSGDRTTEIIKTIRSSKISMALKGKVAPNELINLRNQQILETQTNWFMLLDGDEVWPKKTIVELLTVLKDVNENILGLVLKARIPVGDLFHYQPEAAGRYQILGRVGHYNLRAFRGNNEYRWKGVYPVEAYSSRLGIPLQEQSSRLNLLQNEYWHLTHLRRSSQDIHGKQKLELGERANITLPEVFFKSRPDIVPSPWITYTAKEYLIAQARTPLVRVKRRFLR